jgi:hypothetical protein
VRIADNASFRYPSLYKIWPTLRAISIRSGEFAGSSLIASKAKCTQRDKGSVGRFTIGDPSFFCSRSAAIDACLAFSAHLPLWDRRFNPYMTKNEYKVVFIDDIGHAWRYTMHFAAQVVGVIDMYLSLPIEVEEGAPFLAEIVTKSSIRAASTTPGTCCFFNIPCALPISIQSQNLKYKLLRGNVHRTYFKACSSFS